jgi:hypothetical protein
MNYNIHNLIKIKSNIDIELPYIFKVEDVVNPDLTLHIGDFNDLGKEDAYYYDYKLGPLCSKFFVSDIFGKTKLFYKSPFGSYRIRSPIRKYLIGLVHTIIRWKFLKKNFALFYSACLEKGGEGILIIGPSGSGKTITSISLVNNYGFDYLSDDATIIGKDGMAFCYPSKMKIGPHHIKTHKIDLKYKEKIEMTLRRILLKISPLESYLSGFLSKDVYRIMKNVRVKRQTKIERIFLLEGGNGKIQEVDNETVIKKILNYNLAWVLPNIVPLMRYTFHDPYFYLGDLIAVRDKITRDLVKNSRCFIVSDKSENYDKIIAKALRKE